MCKQGGGANRCLAHNPVSKFVVKVTTVETKAPEELVEKTLVELSKEGKDLPSPAPETVKNWVDTQKFSTQYSPVLSDHDRKIQLNRLERAETENVSGGHFHAWKNVGKAVRTKLAQKLAAGGLMVGMSVSLVGCFANGGDTKTPAPVPSVSASASPSPTKSASQVDSVGQGIIGSGKEVKAADGSSYETITLDPSAPIYQFNNGAGLPNELKAAGYTEADGATTQKLVADYMVKEFVDSTALETGDAGVSQWLHTTGKDYLSQEISQNVETDPASVGQVVLGNSNNNITMPNLIHDGKPREKSLNLTLQEVSNWDQNGYKGIKYSVQYSATYRLTNPEAAAFASKLSKGSLTPDQFLQSGQAQPSVKDPKGTTTYTASGTADFVVGKDAQGKWVITGLRSHTDYDISAFVKQSE